MRRVRAYDRRADKDYGIISAEQIREETRRAYAYYCLNTACGCRYHWRRAVHKHENTEMLPPTFVKNPSSSHIQGCRFDFARIQRENHHYTFLDSQGDLHIRINFPIGGSPRDIDPGSGQLSADRLHAARCEDHFTGVADMKALVGMIEHNFGVLDDTSLDNLYIHYQGASYRWPRLFVDSDEYDVLAKAGQERGNDGLTPPRLCVVAPSHEIKPNKNGHYRFACTTRPIHRAFQVQPVLAVHKDTSALYAEVQAAMQDGRPLLVAGRPFSAPQRGSRHNCYLFIRQASQVTPIATDYWKPVLQRRGQLAFRFG